MGVNRIATKQAINILAIESSCDDTSAAVCRNGKVISNIVANQTVHEKYGGVVPELASRAHQAHIIPSVDRALKEAGVLKGELSAIAFTRGPGLMGSLLVGCSFAKSFSLALDVPLIEVNHLQGHVFSNFIGEPAPSFPFLCLLVSGGHTQLIVVRDFFDMETVGRTTDDAAGEAFDKTAKLLGLPYPGGILIDKYASTGDPHAFAFPEPRIPALDYSFSGLKTAFLYFLRDKEKEDPLFIKNNLEDICASVQHRIVTVLLSKLKKAAKHMGISQIALAGGVSANSGLRMQLKKMAEENGWEIFTPALQYCTDNAAMIAQAAYYKFLAGDFASQDIAPLARMSF